MRSDLWGGLSWLGSSVANLHLWASGLEFDDGWKALPDIIGI